MRNKEEEEDSEGRQSDNISDRRVVAIGDGADGVARRRTDVDGQDEQCPASRQEAPELIPGAPLLRQVDSDRDDGIDEQAGAEGVEATAEGPPGNAAQDVVDVMGDTERSDHHHESVSGVCQLSGHPIDRTLRHNEPPRNPRTAEQTTRQGQHCRACLAYQLSALGPWSRQGMGVPGDD